MLMPISIKMKPGFMYLGATASTTNLEIPMANGGTFRTSYNWQTQQSADGSIVGQQKGRSRSRQDMTWERMDCQTWWTINQWIESNGMTFYARYFNFNIGTWQTRRFYVEAITCTPYRPASANSTNHGQPLYLKDCTMNVYDMGEV